MPTSPTDLKRGIPTFEAICKDIDHSLKQAGKMTLKGSPFIVIKLPLGFELYKDQIIDTYVAAGWAKIQLKSNRYGESDTAYFYVAAEVTYDFPEKPLEFHEITLSADKHLILEGETIVLTVVVEDSEFMNLIEIFHSETVLLTSMMTNTLTYRWENVQAGTYTVVAKATNIKDLTTSLPIVIDVISIY